MLGLARTAAILLALFFTAMTGAAKLTPAHPRPTHLQEELFDPALARVDSLDKAEIWIRARLETDEVSDAAIAEEIARFMRLRFFHDLATFRFSDDWVAFMAGFAWSDLAAPVRPDDLMKYRRGICTQQAMVFQALLARFGIDYATVGFDNPPHMLVGAKIDGVWAIYDSNKEPKRSRIVPYSEAAKGDVLAEMYGGKAGSPAFGFNNDVGLQWKRAAKLGQIEIKNVNLYPAPEAALFHSITGFLSAYGWIGFWLLASAIHVAERAPRAIGWPSPLPRLPSGPIAQIRRAVRPLPRRRPSVPGAWSRPSIHSG